MYTQLVSFHQLTQETIMSNLDMLMLRSTMLQTLIEDEVIHDGMAIGITKTINAAMEGVSVTDELARDIMLNLIVPRDLTTFVDKHRYRLGVELGLLICRYYENVTMKEIMEGFRAK
jgi:hypothetical protein